MWTPIQSKAAVEVVVIAGIATVVAAIVDSGRMRCGSGVPWHAHSITMAMDPLRCVAGAGYGSDELRGRFMVGADPCIDIGRKLWTAQARGVLGHPLPRASFSPGQRLQPLVRSRVFGQKTA